MRSDLKPALYVIIGASLWGVIGLFTRPMYDSGLSALQITFTRCIITLVAMTIAILVVDRDLFKIDIKDIWMFIGMGLVSLVFFSVMYFTAQQMISLSAASVLLYTAPCFVVIMSMILFKEKMTRNKTLALVIAFIGCVFTTGLGFGDLNIGVLYGILAGFGYSLYSIFGKFALAKYKMLTILFYTFLIATVCMLPFIDLPYVADAYTDSGIMLPAIGLGVISTILPYYFYTVGLNGMDAGKASIIAFVEPMVATLVSLIVGDEFGWANILGIVLILLSVILLNTGSDDSAKDVSG